MDTDLLFLGFIKSLGGPRNFIFLVLGLVLGGFLVYQYLQGRREGERRRSSAVEGNSPARGSGRKDWLIAVFALALVISFLVIASLLVNLLAE